jgi:hypothetical protein
LIRGTGLSYGDPLYSLATVKKKHLLGVYFWLGRIDAETCNGQRDRADIRSKLHWRTNMPKQTPQPEKEDVTDVGLLRKKSEDMKKAIEKIFKEQKVKLTPITLLSVAYSVDPPKIP